MVMKPALSDSERVTQFLHIASKTGSMQYYTESDIGYLKGIGDSIGLPKDLIDNIIKAKAVVNAQILKELSSKIKDMKDLKQISQFIETQVSHLFGGGKSSVSDKPLLGSETEHSKHTPSENTVIEPTNNSAFMNQVHNQEIQKMNYEIQELKTVTGGEEENRKVKSKKDGQIRSEKIDSYLTKQPLVPLTKKFTIDR